MSNPNLDRSKAFLRQGNKMFFPANPSNGSRSLEKEYSSITQAKRRSRELMGQKQVIVTREA